MLTALRTSSYIINQRRIFNHTFAGKTGHTFLLGKKKTLFKSPLGDLFPLQKKNAAENQKEGPDIQGPGTYERVKKPGEWVAVGKVV